MTLDAQVFADAMLGKLAKWLRVMGIDVMYDPDATDAAALAVRNAIVLLGAVDPRALVAERVPPYVYASQMTFKHCAICNRLYWGGTHRDNMLRQLQAMLSGLVRVHSETVR